MDEQVQTSADPVRQRARELAEQHFLRQAQREAFERERAEQEAEAFRRDQQEAAEFEAANAPWVPLPDTARPGKVREGWEVGRSGMVRERAGLVERNFPPGDERTRLLNQLRYWRVVQARAAERFHALQRLLLDGWECHHREVWSLVPPNPDGRLPDPGRSGEGFLEALRRPHAEASACCAALEAKFEALTETRLAREAERQAAAAPDAESVARRRLLEDIGCIGLL